MKHSVTHATRADVTLQAAGRSTSHRAFKRAASWALALGLGVAGVAAQAASVTGVNAVVAPGGTVSAVFNFDFGAPLSLSDFNLALSFDHSKLTLVDPFNFLIAKAGVAQSDLDVVAQFPVGEPVTGAVASFIAPPSLAFGATAQIQVNFQSTLLAGQSTHVGLSFDYADALNPGVRQTLAPTSATFSVPAVPEPMSWALMLAGVGVVGVFSRRRKAVH